MSRKDVNNYFVEICEDYNNMIEVLHDMEDYAQNHIVSPEKMDNMRATVEKVKENYMRISYIMYLLDRPVNKKKHKWYDNTTQYATEQSLDIVRAENRTNINNISLE